MLQLQSDLQCFSYHMDGVGAPSGSLKDLDFDRSIALPRSCIRYLLMAEEKGQKQAQKNT